MDYFSGVTCIRVGQSRVDHGLTGSQREGYPRRLTAKQNMAFWRLTFKILVDGKKFSIFIWRLTVILFDS